MAEKTGNGSNRTTAESFEIKVGLAEMLKGGVIMDVTTPDQAKIAEDAGAAAVMALERVPADIRKEGGVARMCSIAVIEGIQKSVSIPVMAKVRIGHFLEARVLEAVGVDFIDESEVLTPADDTPRTTSPSTSSAPPSCAAPATWARRCAASRRAPP
jgi:pyridoxal 5'-phosphate synthase pdxS subunit